MEVWIKSCTKGMVGQISVMRNQGITYADIAKRVGFDAYRIAKFHRLYLAHGDAIFADDRGSNK